MASVLGAFQTEDVIIYSDNTYGSIVLSDYEETLDALNSDGVIKGSFNDDYWKAFSGVAFSGLNFEIDEVAYASHAGKKLHITTTEIKNMLKCYILYCVGSYVLLNISLIRLNTIKEFLENYGNTGYRLSEKNEHVLREFLFFIEVPEAEAQAIMSTIRIKKEKPSNQRTLKPAINYLVLEDAINSLYSGSLDDETFCRWFPVFFWVNITFVLPLRATEILVTPYDCIERKDGKTYLSVRRTRLKGRKGKVYYSVDLDYEIYKYEVPYIKVIDVIEKYKRLTSSQKRDYLFEYSKTSVAKMMSLFSLNLLLEKFMETYVRGNDKYEFAKYASGIKEFEAVTSGDSRPIALSNLYFQNAGEDICRQLAGHETIDTTAGYYTNISEIIMGSAVMQMQRKIAAQARAMPIGNDDTAANRLIKASICTSEKRLNDESNIEDCIKEGHIDDCMGCKYYIPSDESINEALAKRKDRADRAAKNMIDMIGNTLAIKNGTIKELDDLFIEAQTSAYMYRHVCDMEVSRKEKQWQELKNSQKTCY